MQYQVVQAIIKSYIAIFSLMLNILIDILSIQ